MNEYSVCLVFTLNLAIFCQQKVFKICMAGCTDTFTNINVHKFYSVLLRINKFLSRLFCVWL